MRRLAYVLENHPWQFLILNVLAILSIYYALHKEQVLELILKGVLTFTIASVTVLIIKILTKRRRWDIRTIQDYRFPSYHQATATSLCVLAGIYMPLLIPWFIGLIILTAWGRYVIEKHTLDEIAVGAIVGAIAALAIGLSNIR